MKLSPECVACSVSQAVKECRICGATLEQTEAVLDLALRSLQDFRNIPNPTVVGLWIREEVLRLTGVADPYHGVKERDIRTGFALRPMVERWARGAEEPVYAALKASAVGNILDSAIYDDPDLEANVHKELERTFAAPAWEDLRGELAGARTLLLIGDNAGESVFDALLLSMLPPGIEKFYAVRSAPILNDVVRQDAAASGIDRWATIIESGSRAAGTNIDHTTPRFLKLFDTADIVIAKGQGNFETLDTQKRNIYFLLKAKCLVISSQLGVGQGSYVLTSCRRLAEARRGRP